jgi:hypothetical protein
MSQRTVIRFPITNEFWRDDDGGRRRWAWVVRDDTGAAIGMDSGVASKASAQRQCFAFQDALMRASAKEDDETRSQS